MIPERDDREIIHRIIYEELCCGAIEDSSRNAYIKVMEKLVNQGTRAILLACTEIGLLVKKENSPLPLYDTTLLHADAAVKWMLGKSSV